MWPLQEQYEETLYRSDDEFVFGHPALGTPLDPSTLTRFDLRPAHKRAGIEKRFRP